MGRARKATKPKGNRRNQLKNLKRIQQNLAILKKIKEENEAH